MCTCDEEGMCACEEKVNICVCVSDRGRAYVCEREKEKAFVWVKRLNRLYGFNRLNAFKV